MVDDQREVAVARGDGVQHFQAGADDLGADAVGGDGGDAVFAHGAALDDGKHLLRGAFGDNAQRRGRGKSCPIDLAYVANGDRCVGLPSSAPVPFA